MQGVGLSDPALLIMPAHDLTTTASHTGNTSPQTFSHTTSGTDRFLLVWISSDSGTVPSAPTYNGVAMTLVDSRTGVDPQLWCYKLVNPALGANTVSITIGGAPDTWHFAAESFTGVDQTTPNGTNSKSTGTDAAPTTTVTSASGELVADGISWLTLGSSNTATVDGSQTQRFNFSDVDSNGLAGSTEAGASSTVMSWSLAASRAWVSIGVPLKPVLVSGAGAPLFRGRNLAFFDDEEVNRFEFWPAVSVTPTLVIQNASHAHTAQNVVLTQSHTLVVQNAGHAHTAQNLALTQVHSLVIQNASHSHTAQNVALAQTHVLAIQNATHTHTAGSLTLTQVHNLSIANAAHGHTANNLALTQNHQLVVANASHAHTAQNLGLTQAHNLTIQSAIHGHTAQNVVLEAEGQLGIQSATHAHTAQNIVLTQAHSIVIQNSSHAHTAQNLTLTETYNLSIQSALHSHSAANLTLTQAHNLTVSNAVHGHVGQNIVLGTANDLLIQNAVHGHTASHITFAFPTAAINNFTEPTGARVFTVPSNATFTVPAEDRIFEA